jgi:CDP-diacylglycerol--glycerol-3-phosphate 3-phosphatidyltransferase
MSIPNQLTIFRFIITPAFVYAFFQPGLNWKLTTLAIYIIGTITDKLDGYLARKYGWETSLGKFLDPLADKVFLTAGFICLIFFDYMKIWMVVVIVVRDFVVTWLRSYGQKIGCPVRTLEIARWKTGVQTFAIYIAIIYMVAKETLSHYNVEWVWVSKIEDYQLIFYAMLLATLFTAVTGIIYLSVNRHLFAKQSAIN